MIHRLIFIMIISSLGSISYSQETIQEWGRITQAEIDLTAIPNDPEAEAVVLFDLGESSFFENSSNAYQIRFTRVRRVKILTDGGIDFANIEIPIYRDGYNSSEKVTLIEANSYNSEDGRLFKNKLLPTDIFEERLNDNWYYKKFAVPNVKKGTIFEIRYTIETPFLFNLPDWQFQSRIPTMYSQYIVKMIPFYEYTYLAQGLANFDVYSSVSDKMGRTYANITFNDQITTFGMRNVPAFRDESYITSINDYIKKIDFQISKINRPYGGIEEIMTTWPKMIDELNKHDSFGKLIKKWESPAASMLASLGPNATAKDIIEYVKRSYTWNGYYSKYASKTTKELLVQKQGNSADINLLLIALLRTAGIAADPVIISTRDHGKIHSNHPFGHFFNNVIVYVNDGEDSYLTDGTDPLLLHNRIPVNCINENGLIISKESTDVNWVSLNPNLKSTVVHSLQIKIDEKISVSAFLTATEFDAHYLRKSIKNDSIEFCKYLFRKGFSEIERVKFLNLENLNRPYIASVIGTVEAEAIENQLIIQPFLFFPEEENGLKQKERTYPIDFTYSKSKEFNTVITFSEEYRVTSFPSSTSLNSDLMEIQLTGSQEGNKLTLSGKYTFKKSIYKAEEYQRMKQSLDLIVRKFNEPVVLEKI